MRYWINLNTFSLKKSNKNKEFKFDLIVAKDNATSNRKIL